MEESISSSRTTAFFYAANSAHSTAAPSDDSGWTAYFHDDYHLLPADQNKLLHRHPHHGGDCATASTVSSASKMGKVKVKKGSEERKKRPRPEPAEDPLQDTASSPPNATPLQQLQDGCHIAECEEGETVGAAATECRTRQWDHWDGPGAEKGGSVCLISPCYSN